LPPEARFCLSCGTRVEAAAPDATIDPLLEALKQAIGFQYRIERLLGRGGMGAVYLAHELALDRDVAIKVLPPDQAGPSDVRERFRREARTAARLRHPHIVPLHTFGEVSGLVYFVMGYVPGESLAARLHRQGPIEPEAARTLLAGICDALDYAHRQGIVHRDIKPDNILIDADSGAPLLTDFGIAKAAMAHADLTTPGQVIGTPHYMSPEQASGRSETDPRSDLYSLGVVAYEMVSGRRPFDAESPLEALTQRLTRDPKPLGSVTPNVPSDLALAVDRCLQRDVTKRWPDAKSLRDVLLPPDDEPEDTVAGRMLRIGVTIGLLAILGFGYLSVYLTLNPDVRLPGRGLFLFLSLLVPMAIFAILAALRLRAEGLDRRSILLKAFQQPRWWRSWYPRALRRRGDVWHRLPPEIRRFRRCLGICQLYMLGIFLPLQWMTARRYGANARLIWLATGLAAIAWMALERRRATTFVRAKLGTSVAEASAMVSTPTWRLPAWRRAPTGSLLLGQTMKTSPVVSEPTGAVTRLADSASSEQPTRMS
jgi:hypothetical protein